MINKALVLFILFTAVIVIYAPVTFSIESAQATTGAQVHMTSAESLLEAQNVFFEYHNDEQNFSKAIDIVNAVLANDSENCDALVLLSRIWLTYGHYIPDHSSDEKWNRFKTGSEIAKKAIKADSSNADAYFYYVANEASLAKSKGIFGSFFLVKKLKKNIAKALELDPNHTEAIAMKGAVLNAIPGIMGGDVKEAEKLIRKSLLLDPHLTSTKIFLAKNLVKQQHYEEAKAVLNEVLEETKPTVLADWHLNKRSAYKWLDIIAQKQQSET
ncbi:MAG: tetratricopeptide repeat protein [Candidatus Dadabacteria bacterium]|nr:tetratricopeptide repeat protein [Candidatus Dadabacteria bacterium]NIS08742.1 tetratricopeptide repeat protein [Candidatus Dadabacteria bacterium]NIV42685.1 tetratricopeptide repeat protein [Candidatus Dadabacteria bacterium]NIX15428.1 tetratricopeptide repeat protein [Candidatus Dadabacteria bacterium]NIY22090.1 tetratricopeptide repeat protein [Candidatus Dadabacteria bacterium]